MSSLSLAVAVVVLGFLLGIAGHVYRSPAMVAAGIALILAGIVLGSLSAPVADVD